MRYILISLMIVGLLPAVISCSGGGNGVSHIIDPGIPLETTGREGQNQTHCFWGIWQFVVKPEAGTLEIIPLRNVGFHLNALPFLEPPPLVNLTLESLKFTGNIIDADIGLRHPFLGLTEFTGFDVCGIFISNGSITGFDDSSLRMAGSGDTRLLNPDGYSRWWNPAEFMHGNTIFNYKDGLLGTPDSIGDYNSTLNGYKYYCDDLGPNDTLDKVTLAKRGLFSAGKKNIRHYTIDMSAGLIFNYAVDACWVFPQGSPPWMAPDDFAPEANRPEAYRTKETELANTLWNNGSASGGDLKLSIDVYDWFNVALNKVKVESPGNFTAATSTTPIGGGAGYSTYEVEILNATPAPSLIRVLISVESEAVGYGDLLPGKPVTACFTRDVAVAPEKPGWIKVTSPNGGEKWKVGTDETITWESSGITGTVFIEYSKDNFGSDVHSIATDVVNNGSHLWENIPNDPSDTVRVRISSTDDPGINDKSDANFSIVADSLWWQSHMYNINNIGWNPTATMPDPSALQQQWKTGNIGFKFTTPVVAEGKIFFSTNSTYWERPDMTLWCYNLATGGLVWSKPINPSSLSTGARVFSCPVWWRGPDDINRVAVGGDKVYCFNADTGAEFWTYDTTYGGSDMGWWSNQMQEYNGMLLARTRSNPLYVLDFKTGGLISTVICSDVSEGGCAAKDGKVYINSSYYVDCADITTGAILWSTKLPVENDNMNHWVSPAIVGNRLYVTSFKGVVYCLSIADEGGYTAGQIIWYWNDPLKPIGSTNMYAGAGVRQSGGVTRLYVPSTGTGSYVYCLEDQGASASLIWRSGQTGSFEGAAVWSNAPGYPEGIVYCPDAPGNNLYAFDASNGALVWTYPAGAVTPKSGVSIVKDMLVLMTNQDVRLMKAP